MLKILLIHGYGIGIRSSIFKPAEGEDAGFGAFKELIKEGIAKVFRWDIQSNFGLPQVVNVKNYLAIYKKERDLAISLSLQDRLFEVIQSYKPTVIICHSMGCYLFLHFSNQRALPSFVTKIIFVQADLPYDFKILNKDILKRLEIGQLTFINYYCPWDPTLLADTIMKKSKIAGAVGASVPYVKNEPFPLYRKINLHNCNISNKKFLDKLKKHLVDV